MTTIPPKMRAEMADDPFYHTCARQAFLGDHVCQRNPIKPLQAVEWEHALIFGGKKVQQKFAIVPLCWWAHEGPGKNKDIPVWIALNRATGEEMESICKGKDYRHEKARLNAIYGVPEVSNIEIQYEP